MATTLSGRVRIDLLLLRSLVERAESSQREGHDIGTMVALLLSDMAAETASRLALAHLEKRASADTVVALLEALVVERPALGVHADAVKRLRKARNPVQHGGAIPAGSVVVLHVRAMREFVADVARVVFGVELSDVTAADLVVHPQMRTTLRAAADALVGGDMAAAVAAAAAAFEVYRIVWGRWTRRALGITRDDESFHAQRVSIAAASLGPGAALEPLLENDSWESATNVTMGLPIPLLARWRRVVRLATAETDDEPIGCDELKQLIDKLALTIWSMESAHPYLLDGMDSGEG